MRHPKDSVNKSLQLIRASKSYIIIEWWLKGKNLTIQIGLLVETWGIPPFDSTKLELFLQICWYHRTRLLQQRWKQPRIPLQQWSWHWNKARWAKWQSVKFHFKDGRLKTHKQRRQYFILCTQRFRTDRPLTLKIGTFRVTKTRQWPEW